MNAGDIAMGAGASTTRADIPAGTPSDDYTAVENAIAIGTQAYAGWDNSMAFGPNSQVFAPGGVAIGSGAQVGAMGGGSVALGQNSIAGGPMEVSVGAIGNERRITNVAAGYLGTDALNVGQFDSGAAALAEWIGGGAYFGLETEGGMAGNSQPTFTIQGAGYSDVASAFAAVDFDISDLYSRIATLPPGPQGPTGPQGPAGPGTGSDPFAVHYDSVTSASVTLQGENGTQIRNVAAGTVGTDAANVDQVQEALAMAKTYTDIRSTEAVQQAVSEANAYTAGQVSRLDKRVDYALASATASSQAAAALAGSDPNNHNRVAAGFGSASGASAWNVTYQHVTDNRRWAWNVGVTSGQDSPQVGGGVSLGW
jgi:autotransporter adhesin